jgi:4-hydroxy-4-methyl-2-oxoglutarate aldolase
MKTSAQEHTAQHLARLSRLDACAVSDALDKLGLSGAVSGLRQLSSQRRISGRVVTVKLVAAGGAPRTPGMPVRHLGTTAIDEADPGDIVVIEQRTGIDAGSWGGILSLGAKLRGVAGVIADGPVRDIDEARQYDLPIFARATTAFTARGRVVEAGTDVPVTIGSVTVEAGDFAIADGSGVVFIGQADIGRVLDAAERIATLEAVMAKALLAGSRSAEVMGANYENMLGKEPRS